MFDSRNGLWMGAMLAAAELFALSGAALATNQSQQRQEGRNANQAAKKEARAGKRSTAELQTRRATPSAGKRSATRSRKAASKGETSSTRSFYAVDPYALAFTNVRRPSEPAVDAASLGTAATGLAGDVRIGRGTGGWRADTELPGQSSSRHSSVRARPCRFPHKCG